MDKQKLRGARRAGFIYGLFRAAPIPTEILPKNLAKEAFEQMDEKAPSSIEEMRNKLKDEMGLDAIGFIPTRDRKSVQMIHQPYKKKARAQKEEFPVIKEDDELVLEPEDYAELEIEMEDPNDLVIDVDEDMKARARLRKAQREYMKDKRRQARKAAKQALDPGARSLGDVFMMSQMAAPEPFSMKKKK